MAIMYITHDLGVVAEMADQAVVMYLGKVVERSDAHRVLPAHPYTRPSCAPSAHHRAASPVAGGDPGDGARPTHARRLPFHPRCAHAVAACREGEPPWIEVEADHWARCILHAR